MSTHKFLQGAMASIAVAAVAAGLLTAAGAVSSPNFDKNTASGKLAAVCGLAYDKATYKELHNVFNKQAVSLERLGLDTTKADVCVEVNKVAVAKNSKSVSDEQFAQAAYHARAVVGAAILYRATSATMDKAALQEMGQAFETKSLARWQPGAKAPTLVQEEGKAFITSNLALAGKGDIDATAIKDPQFSSFVYNLNLSP